MSDDVVDVEVGRLALRTFRLSIGADHQLDGPRIDAWGGGRWVFNYGDSKPPPDAQMTSVAVQGLNWPEGACTATCASLLTQIGAHDGHKTPSKGCHCGVYGTLSWEHLHDQYPGYADQCVAVIAAEGNTIMGDRGLRCECARVIAYWCADNLVEVCGRQFVDAQRFSSVDEMLEAHGIPKWKDEDGPKRAEAKKLALEEAAKTGVLTGVLTWTISSNTGAVVLQVPSGSNVVPALVAPEEEKKKEEEKEGWAKANPSLEQKQEQRAAAKRAILKKLGLA